MVTKRKKIFQDKVIVITGASSGLGLKIAKEFIKENASLAICARRIHKLKRIYRNEKKDLYRFFTSSLYIR